MARRVATDRPTVVERAALRERALVAGGLLLAVLASWGWIAAMSADMYGPMTGPSAWMMTLRWGARHLGLLFAMWAAMMAGMLR